MPKKTLFMETTEISSAKTVGQIIGELGEYPFVRQVSQTFNGSGGVRSIEFLITDEQLGITSYRLEPRIEEIFKILQGKQTDPVKWEEKDRQRAPKVAWRQIYRWMQAQLAMVDSKMAAPQEVFFAHMVNKDGTTMFQKFVEFKALPPASGG